MFFSYLIYKIKHGTRAEAVSFGHGGDHQFFSFYGLKKSDVFYTYYITV